MFVCSQHFERFSVLIGFKWLDFGSNTDLMKKYNTANLYYIKLPHWPVCLPQLTWPYSTPW